MPTIGACTDDGLGAPYFGAPPKLYTLPSAAAVRYLPESAPGYENRAWRPPVPIGSRAVTLTVPASFGATTIAFSVPAITTGAILLPNLIVAFSRPTPRSVTNSPALPWRGEIELISGHASPDAIGRPNPLARSKPLVVLNVRLC